MFCLIWTKHFLLVCFLLIIISSWLWYQNGFCCVFFSLNEHFQFNSTIYSVCWLSGEWIKIWWTITIYIQNRIASFYIRNHYRFTLVCLRSQMCFVVFSLFYKSFLVYFLFFCLFFLLFFVSFWRFFLRFSLFCLVLVIFFLVFFILFVILAPCLLCDHSFQCGKPHRVVCWENTVWCSFFCFALCSYHLIINLMSCLNFVQRICDTNIIWTRFRHKFIDDSSNDVDMDTSPMWNMLPSAQVIIE